MTPVSVLFLVAAVLGLAYLAGAILTLLRFVRRPCALASEFLPTITILKPIAGIEPDLYENLWSFCDQQYTDQYEVLFCMADETDSARPVVDQIVQAFPEHTRVVYGSDASILNPKIANLAKPGVATTREIVIVSDSDVRVGPTFLRAMASCFESQAVGAATCLYSGSPNASFVSRIGALGIDDGLAPSVLVALALGELRFCLGAVMAVRGTLLAAIGGLTALGRTLADDHMLGQLVTRNGYRVELSRYVVTTTVPETRFAELWFHELRWARTEFELARAGYAFSFLIYAVPMALIYLAVSRNLVVGLPVLVVAIALRIVVHRLARRGLNVEGKDDTWLIVPRDFLSLAVWAVSLLGRSVRWRDKKYRKTTG